MRAFLAARGRLGNAKFGSSQFVDHYDFARSHVNSTWTTVSGETPRATLFSVEIDTVRRVIRHPGQHVLGEIPFNRPGGWAF